jgi:bifunctional non-homologous end joining protein LigD
MKTRSQGSVSVASPPSKWIKPQLTRLVDEAPAGEGWLHEIKYDGYRMHARIDGGDVRLLTRTCLDWSHRYRRTIEALRGLKPKSAYIDGELCALRPDGVRLSAASRRPWTKAAPTSWCCSYSTCCFSTVRARPACLTERKARLKRLLRKESDGLRYTDHVVGDGPRFREHACKLGLEGAISKRADQTYAPGDRGIWVKSKCLNREEFVVVGWTDPEGSREHLGALLLGYYTEDGRLHYSGQVGTGITDKELKRLAGVLKPLHAPKMPLAESPPRDSRSGSPLKLSKVHWVRPQMVVEVTYLTWTEDNLLRQVSYQGQREDKPARQVIRLVPHPRQGS